MLHNNTINSHNSAYVDLIYRASPLPFFTHTIVSLPSTLYKTDIALLLDGHIVVAGFKGARPGERQRVD